PVFFTRRTRHTRSKRDWSSEVCSSDLAIFSHIGEGLLDTIIEHNRPIPIDMLSKYQTEDSIPVVYNKNLLKQFGLEVIEADILEIGRATCRERDKSDVGEITENKTP